MTSQATVSVVIATYGAERWRELAKTRAHPSTFEQTATEIISHHSPDGSLASARNEGASRAIGDWLLFLDADDELAPGYLIAMRRTMHLWNLWRPHDLIVNPLLLVPAVSYVANEATEPEIPAWAAPLIDVNCAVIGTLVPRSLFMAVGGFDREPIYEDWALWLRCIREGARMVGVRDAVYRAHVSDRSRNRQVGNVAGETYAAVRARHQHAFDWNDVAAYKVGS